MGQSAVLRCHWHDVCVSRDFQTAPLNGSSAFCSGTAIARSRVPNVNNYQITEFAAQIAAHNRLIIESPQPIEDARLQASWHAARGWLIGQLRRMDACVPAELNESTALCEDKAVWSRLVPLLEEVFCTEMLMRVWGAVLAARENRHVAGGGDVALNILILQLKVRQRALKLMVDAMSGHRSERDVAAIDRTRRKCERWTDVWVGGLGLGESVGRWACDERRARDFGVDYFQKQTHTAYQCTWKLLAAGIRTAFAAADGAPGETTTDSGPFFRAILRCLPVDAFHNDGPPLAQRTYRSRRMDGTSDRPPTAAALRPLRRVVFFGNAPSATTTDGISFTKLRREQE